MPATVQDRPDLNYIEGIARQQKALDLRSPQGMKVPGVAFDAKRAVVATVPRVIVANPDVRTYEQGANLSTIPFTTDASRALEIAPADKKRRYILIQNNTGSALYIAFGRPASIVDLQIPAGGNYEPSIAPLSSVNVFSLIGGNGVLIQG